MRKIIPALTSQPFVGESKPVNNTFRLAMVPLFICLAAALPAWGRRESVAPVEEEKNTVIPEEYVLVQASGRVRLVGNEPFPEMVITGPERQWYIEKGDEHKLKDLQHRTVTIEGMETVLELFFANGRPAGQRRILKDITIISVE